MPRVQRSVLRNSSLVLVFLLLAACSAGGAGVEPKPGQFDGTTSQGKPISLWVEEVEGELIISAVQFTLTMEATSFTVTTELMAPNDRQIPIEQGGFSGSESRGDSTEELSGSFTSSKHVVGTLNGTHVHPQGLGTAVGAVTFEADWVEP